jgi:hypothetical protein
MLTRFLLVALLLLLVVRAVWRLFGGIIEGAGGVPRIPAQGEAMARDPVCGTFVVRARALTKRGAGGTPYFC